MRGVRLANGFDANFGEADVANVSRFDHVGDGPDGVFDRNFWIEARGTVDIDVVDFEALQCVGKKILYGCRTRVDADPGAIGSAHSGEFYREQSFVATVFQGASNKHLIVPHAVKVASVEQIDTRVER